MGLFGALFGGAFLVGNAVKENYRADVSNMQVNNVIANSNKLTNYAFENSAREKLFDINHKYTKIKTGVIDNWRGLNSEGIEIYTQNRRDLIASIPEKDLQYIFGNNWKDILERAFDEEKYSIRPNSGEMNGFSSTWELLLNVWMSQKGIISRRYCICEGYHPQFPPYEWRKSEADKQKWRELASRACTVIARNVADKSGMNVSLSYCRAGEHAHAVPGYYWNF